MGILLDKLTEYGNSDFYPYHMPGHKRQALAGFPQALINGDITEIADFDNLHQPEGILLDAQRRAAEAYGAEESFYLVNGSTCGILSAISVTVPFGGHLLIARNCHKSVYHAAYLRQLQLSYIYPALISGFDICEAVTAAQVEEQLQQDASIQAVLIVSPTYEGRIADVRAIAEVVHAKGIPLIVDEAHGAHLGFCEGFAVNSSRLGADLVINSVHKTLPAMTQTALLHCNGRLIDREILRRFLHIYQSSSPSYILMASIDHAVQAAAKGAEAFQRFRGCWTKMLQELAGLQKIRILPELQSNSGQQVFEESALHTDIGKQVIYSETIGSVGIHDIGKLVISTKGAGISGKRLADLLREKYHLEMEMACETYVLAMFTLADAWGAYERLIQALLEIDHMLLMTDEQEVTTSKSKVTRILNVQKEKAPEIQTGIPFCRAWDHKKKEIPLEDAEGCAAGEFINLYPPGTPIAVPGEVINRQIIQQIKKCLSSGLEVQGVRKQEENIKSEVLNGESAASEIGTNESQTYMDEPYKSETEEKYVVSVLV